ncbi:MAG: PQQ-binding-like beta-propeller repeat protein [Steroidobacteraceae bacterium]|nr:PQQ-binding-like beta-propeller repeat protein [Steroidobacteraceae bacterium]
MLHRILCAIAISIAMLASVESQAATADKAWLADEPDPRNWASPGRTSNETRFSPLEEINRETVGRLRLAWSLDLVVGSAHSTPLAVDGVVYVAAGFTVVHAVDAKTGKMLWRYDSGAATLASQKLRAGSGIRGLSFQKARLFVGTQDGRLVALDAKTGVVVWTTQVLDAADRSFISGAPRVCGDKVIIGFGAGAMDEVRGGVSAFDVLTGKQLWRWWSVDEKQSGGAIWNAITCDAAKSRVYVGVGEPRGAGAQATMAGIWVPSVVALDVSNGTVAWKHNTDAGGTLADASLDITLATLAVGGSPRRVILHAPKDGFVYVIDAASGQRLSAKKLDTGAHLLAPQAFSPKTGLLYVPTSRLAEHASSLTAWDPVNQRSLWSQPSPGAFGGGVLVTLGDLVFAGQADGYVNAFDAAGGRKLWQFYAATAALGAPISFAVGNKQYIAILVAPPAGTPGSLGAPSAKFGWDSRLHPRRLLVFTLDGTAKLPPTPPPARAQAQDGPELAVDEGLAKEGAAKYASCAWCHGANAIAGGMAPDLRASAVPLNAASFATVVRDGLEIRGMPKFGEATDRDLEALRHYIRVQARLETRPDGVAPPPPAAPPSAADESVEEEAERKPPGSLQSEPVPPQ